MQNWKKTFFTIWAGQAASYISSAVLQTALIWYITFQTNSAAMLSIASIVAFLPQAILGPFIGVLIDRWSRKVIMVVSDLFVAAVAGALAIIGLFGEIPIWTILLALAVRSVGTAFHQPSLSAVTPLIVPEENLTKYAGYSQSVVSVTQILSPVLAAILYATWSMPQIILLDVAGAVVASLTVAFVRIPELPRQETTEKPHFFTEMKEGMRVLYRQRGLFYLMWIGALFMVVFMPLNALFPLMSLDYFGGTTTHASIVEVLFAVGMLLGGLLLGITGGFKNRVVSLFFSFVLMGVAFAASGLLPPEGFVGFAIASAVMGLSVPLYQGVNMALYQEKIEPQYLGRVFSLTGSIMTLAMPVGLVFSWLYADRVGVNTWFLYSGLAVLVISILIFAVPSVRNLDKKAAPAVEPE